MILNDIFLEDWVMIVVNVNYNFEFFYYLRFPNDLKRKNIVNINKMMKIPIYIDMSVLIVILSNIFIHI